MGLLRRTREPQQVIDLRDPVSGSPQWGSPVPCPSCTGRGYLDHIDPFRHIMYLHCTRCGEKYELAKADIEGVVA